MPWRYWSALLLSLLLCAPLATAQPAHCQDGPGLLWKIERPGLPPSWLFGTIHLSDPQVARLPTATLQALASSRVVATELKLDDPSVPVTLLQAMLAPQPQLPTLLGERDYPRLLHALRQRGYPDQLAGQLQPWAAWMLLLQPPPAPDAVPPLDLQVANQARQRQIPNLGLETPAEQLALFQNIEPARQRRLLLALLDHPQAVTDGLRELSDCYRRGNLEALLAFSARVDDASTPPEDRDWARAWMKQMNEARNQRMLLRLQPQLSQGGVFVAVGALHLPGPEGLLSLLRAQGYRVSAAPPLSH